MRITRCRLLLAVLSAALLAAPPARAQGTPEDAARAYLRVLGAADWRGTAALMHPEALDELKGFFARIADADSAGQLIGSMFHVASSAEFRQLPAQEVYARLLSTVGRNAPQLTLAMRGMQTEVIGSVSEGPDVAHVVYRLDITLDDVTSSKVDVLSFRRSGDRWMALLSGDLRALAQSMARALPAP